MSIQDWRWLRARPRETVSDGGGMAASTTALRPSSRRPPCTSGPTCPDMARGTLEKLSECLKSSEEADLRNGFDQRTKCHIRSNARPKLQISLSASPPRMPINSLVRLQTWISGSRKQSTRYRRLTTIQFDSDDFVTPRLDGSRRTALRFRAIAYTAAALVSSGHRHLRLLKEFRRKTSPQRGMVSAEQPVATCYASTKPTS